MIEFSLALARIYRFFALPFFRFHVCFFLLSTPTLHAAPPKLDWLYPAGVGVNTTTTITMNDVATWPVQVWIDREQGLTLAAGKEKNTLIITTAADVIPGVRWLRIFNGEGASSLRPLIVGSLPEIQEKEPNNAVSEAQVVTEKNTINGRLEKKGDVDGFRITLKRGQTLIASLTANEILASPMDGVLQLCDGEGNVLTQSDDEHGLDPQIVHEIPRDGEYLVRVFAFPAAADSSISFAGGVDYIYRLTLTTGPFADHALPMSVTGNEASTVRVHGWNLPHDGEPIALSPVDADSARDNRNAVLHHSSLANTLTLQRTSHNSLIAAPSSSESKPQAVAMPCVITGKISAPSQRASFRFPASKGKSLRLTVESQSLGFPLDPVLTVRDSTGKTLSEADDSNKALDPTIVFAPPADGEYEILLRDLHDRGGFRFVYRLTIEPVTPDFAVTLDRDSFAATPDKPLEIAVTIDRLDGFTGDVSIEIQGLPQGITVAPVVSKHKSPTEKAVKLTIGPGHAAWSGPVRLAGKAEVLERSASFTTLGETRHNAAWLTILDAKK